jgi:uncharacterized protein YgbK (DUF1537 family)
VTVVRLLADDLTGAMDSGVAFAGAGAPVPVRWTMPAADGLAGSLAGDSETREAGPAEAAAAAARWTPILADADIAFKKVDSLLRGSVAAEIAACRQHGRFRAIVVAPAFPAQDRITRGGWQHYRDAAAGEWRRVPVDLAGALAALGVPVRHGIGGGDRASPVLLCDAETEEDLTRLVADAPARLPGPILWCGTAGLARALAGAAPPMSGSLVGERPMLAIIGSDSPVMARQIAVLEAARADTVIPLTAGTASAVARAVDGVAARLRAGGIAALALRLPSNTDRGAARTVIADAAAALADGIPRPGSLFVSGGETLFLLCRALAADHLLAAAEARPGIPVSTLCGGAWDGVRLISKSGGFGGPELLLDLLQRE